jgi:hypothetical protein
VFQLGQNQDDNIILILFGCGCLDGLCGDDGEQERMSYQLA